MAATSNALEERRAVAVCREAGVPMADAITKARKDFPRQRVETLTNGKIKTFNPSSLQRKKQLLRLVIHMDNAPLAYWRWEARLHDSHDPTTLVYGFSFRPADGVAHDVFRAGDQILRADGKSILGKLEKPSPAIVEAIWKTPKRMELMIFRPTDLERASQFEFAQAVDNQMSLLYSFLYVVVVSV